MLADLAAAVPFDFDMMARAMPVLLDGLAVTLELSALAIMLSLHLGRNGLGARSPVAPLAAAFGLRRIPATGACNAPVLVQMYFFYFGFAMKPACAFPASTGRVAGDGAAEDGVLSMSEIYRAGIETVRRPAAEEAGLALGMLPFEAFRIVIFPQAVRLLVLPPMITSSSASSRTPHWCLRCRSPT